MQSHASAISLLKQGSRFCRSCGAVSIPPGYPAWMDRCKNCYDAHAIGKFCATCGVEIDKERRLWARRKGGEAKRCKACSEGRTKPCVICGCFHPRGWTHPESSDDLFRQWQEKQTEKLRAAGRLCIDCEDEIEKDRIEYAERQGGTCKRCWLCSKKAKRPISPQPE